MQSQYKVCPQCGLQASLDQKQCIHCLHVYQTHFTPPVGQTQAFPAQPQASYQQAANPQQPARPRFPIWAWVLSLTMLGLCIVMPIVGALVGNSGSPDVSAAAYPQELLGVWDTRDSDFYQFVIHFLPEGEGFFIDGTGRSLIYWIVSEDVVYVWDEWDQDILTARVAVENGQLYLNERLLMRTRTPGESSEPSVPTRIRTSQALMDEIRVGMTGAAVEAKLGAADETKYFGPQDRVGRLLIYYASDGNVFVKVTYSERVESITRYNPF